jgi:dTMP kinase
MDSVRAMQRVTLGDFQPDLTLMLDVNPRDGLARAGARGTGEDRFERFDDGFHARLRDGFRTIVREEPQRCALVDGNANVETVAASIWAIVSERLRP